MAFKEVDQSLEHFTVIVRCCLSPVTTRQVRGAICCISEDIGDSGLYRNDRNIECRLEPRSELYGTEKVMKRIPPRQAPVSVIFTPQVSRLVCPANCHDKEPARKLVRAMKRLGALRHVRDDIEYVAAEHNVCRLGWRIRPKVRIPASCIDSCMQKVADISATAATKIEDIVTGKDAVS